MNKLTSFDFPTFHRTTVGFDRLFDEIERSFANSTSQGYPPYNVAQFEDNEWAIAIAVAGFGMDDLDITLENNVLTIEGEAPKGDDDVNYLHKGIAGRNFRRQFTLADHIEVVDATLDRGILTVQLRREVPEELQAKKIRIKAANEVNTIESDS